MQHYKQQHISCSRYCMKIQVVCWGSVSLRLCVPQIVYPSDCVSLRLCVPGICVAVHVLCTCCTCAMHLLYMCYAPVVHVLCTCCTCVVHLLYMCFALDVYVFCTCCVCFLLYFFGFIHSSCAPIICPCALSCGVDLMMTYTTWMLVGVVDDVDIHMFILYNTPAYTVHYVGHKCKRVHNDCSTHHKM